MTYVSALFRPDDGEAPAVGQTVTPAPVEPSKWDQFTGWAGTFAGQHTTAITTAVIAALVLFIVVALVRRRRLPSGVNMNGNTGRKTMVAVAASIASTFTIYSMWRVFEHQLHITNDLLRIALCGVFEIAMVSSALNSRAFRLKWAADEKAEQARREKVLAVDPSATFVDEKKPVDVDGIAVWVIAFLSGLWIVGDSTTPVAAGVGFVVPILAAWLWERLIAAELRTFTRAVKKRSIVLRISLERVLVALRLAEPSGRGVDEVERARRRTAFTVAAFRLHTRLADNARAWRVTIARWRLRRAGIAIMRQFGVAELTAARADVATLYGIENATSPDAVAGLTPWRASGVIDGTATSVTPPPSGRQAVTNTVTPVEAPPVTDVTPTVARPATGVRHVPAPRREVARKSAVTDAQTGATASDGTRVRPLSRDLIDEQFRSWTVEQVEAYAASRARAALTETGNKTTSMREYFLTCLALGVEPTGSAMARAVDAAGSLGRTKAKEWHGELAVDDAEQVLRDALARVAAERAAGGDDRG